MSEHSENVSSPVEPRLGGATLSGLFDELNRRGLAYAAWNSAGCLVRSNNPRSTDGERIFGTELDDVDDSDLLVELAERGISHIAWDEHGKVIARHDVPETLPSDDHNFEEAVARLRRGDVLEALIHLERVSPALNGLHDAVRNLQR